MSVYFTGFFSFKQKKKFVVNIFFLKNLNKVPFFQFGKNINGAIS